MVVFLRLRKLNPFWHFLQNKISNGFNNLRVKVKNEIICHDTKVPKWNQMPFYLFTRTVHKFLFKNELNQLIGLHNLIP